MQMRRLGRRSDGCSAERWLVEALLLHRCVTLAEPKEAVGWSGSSMEAGADWVKRSSRSSSVEDTDPFSFTPEL